MRRYITLLIAICSPIIATSHSLIYEDWQDWLGKNLSIPQFWSRLAASLVISGIGLGVVILFSWLVWRLRSKRTYGRIRGYYWLHLNALMTFMEQFQRDINREIDLFGRIADKDRYRNLGRWTSLRLIYDTNFNMNHFSKVDISIIQCLQKNPELTVVSELLEPISRGFQRLQEILGAGEWDLNTMHRAEEVVADIRYRHLEQFRNCLARLS